MAPVFFGSALNNFGVRESVSYTHLDVYKRQLYSLRVGKDLEVDPEYLRRLEAGEFDEAVKGAEALKSPWKAAVSVGIFVLATVLIVLFGSIEELRRNGDTMLQMPSVIEILMSVSYTHLDVYKRQ